MFGALQIPCFQIFILRPFQTHEHRLGRKLSDKMPAWPPILPLAQSINQSINRYSIGYCHQTTPCGKEVTPCSPRSQPELELGHASQVMILWWMWFSPRMGKDFKSLVFPKQISLIVILTRKTHSWPDPVGKWCSMSPLSAVVYRSASKL